ncbi:MAG: DUF1489 family protein [Asticcacaulis sp.]
MSEPVPSSVHLVKLCVGIDSVERLEALVAARRGETLVHTRNTPKQAEALLEGGSLYWVIKGQILCRMPIARIETVGEGAASVCHIWLTPTLIRTQPQPKRPFQGWRYLKAADAPPDLDAVTGQGVPEALLRDLSALGLM